MKLFEPGKIGKLIIKNRIIMAPMGNALADLDGRVSQREIDYYVERAKGGVGLISTQAVRSRQIEQLPYTPLVSYLIIDGKIYGSMLNKLAENAHDCGAKLSVQVAPGLGRNVGAATLRSTGAVAPSPVPAFADPSVIARELTTEEVERLTQA